MTSDKNYYQSTASAALNTTSLEGDIQAQVCVIGGGYSGVNVALELAESGVDVVLLEARDIGWGGSGRNGGQVICGIGHDPQTVRKQLSAADFDSLYSMGLE
ncbi:MAG: FAD-dependent oxidoreductase, partial [Pseudomonadales bacterium]